MTVSRFALLAGGQRRELGPEECIRDLVCQGFRTNKQGPTGRGFLLRNGTGQVLAKKFGYRDGSGRVVSKF